MSPLLLFASLVALTVGIPAVTSSGPVSWSCLNCMKIVENGPPSSCNDDGGSLSCGVYQIKADYYTDAQFQDRTLTRSWRDCSFSTSCSEKAIQAYMSRYATWSRLGVTPTCEDFARIHNGGPNGYKRSSTLRHWKKVENCLN